MRVLLALGVLAVLPTAAEATGRYTCEPVEESKWLTLDQMTEKLTASGWQVNRAKPDGGCWEVYGVTPDGLKVEGYFHPATGQQLMLNQRGMVIFDIKDQPASMQ